MLAPIILFCQINQLIGWMWYLEIYCTHIRSMTHRIWWEDSTSPVTNMFTLEKSHYLSHGNEIIFLLNFFINFFCNLSTPVGLNFKFQQCRQLQRGAFSSTQITFSFRFSLLMTLSDETIMHARTNIITACFCAKIL